MVRCILGFPFSPCPRYVKWPFETHCVFSIVSGVCCFWHIYTVYSIHRHDTTAHLSFFTRDSTWRPWEWVVVCSLSQCWYKLPFGTSPALCRGDSPMHYVWRLDWPGPLFCNTQARLGWRRKWAGIAVNADKANHGLFCDGSVAAVARYIYYSNSAKCKVWRRIRWSQGSGSQAHEVR